MGTAHIEGFGSIDGVIKSKTELYEYLRKVNGIAIYNNRNPLLTEKIFRMVNRAVPYSDPTGIELIIEMVPSDLNLVIAAKYQHRTYNIPTRLLGFYNLENVTAAIATGLFFEVPMDAIAEAVEGYQPANNRSQLKITKNNTLVCDSYNANPTSMGLALQSFAGIQGDHKMVILGDMLELGEKSNEEHIKILNALQSYGFEKTFLVGPVFKEISSEYGIKAFPDVNSLNDFLRAEPLTGKTILIKGSRGIGLERTYELL
jgi:UDP-N-acetylmuramoyl-tripeptide--D-alanyl-D-alanine ligase